MERFKCPECNRIVELTALDLNNCGIPYCRDCGPEEIEMEIMDDEPEKITSYKPMFTDKWETYNDAGQELSNEIGNAIRQILQRWCDNGYKTIDIEHIAASEVNGLCAEMRLRRNIDKNKKMRKLKKKGGK